MDLRQMFPSKTLDGEDLYAFCRDKNGGQPVTLTVETIDYKTRESDLGGAEIVYYMYVREFKKPFKLSKTRANVIARVLGETDTDNWAGRTFKAKGDIVNVQGQDYWIVQPVIDPPEPTSPLPKKMDITGMAFAPRLGAGRQAPGLNPAAGAKPLGIDRAIKMANLLHNKTRTIKDAAEHLKKVAPQIYAETQGKNPPDWPDAAAPWIAQMCKGLPNGQPDLGPAQIDELRASWSKPEVIDPITGELLNGPPPGGPASFEEEDIPF